MDDKAKYRLNESAAQSKLDAFGSAGDAGSLASEISLLRYLISEAVANGSQPLLIRDLTSTLSMLIKTNIANELVTSRSLSKDKIKRLMHEFGSLITQEFKDIPDYQIRLDRAYNKMQATVSSAKNEPEPQKRLSRR